MKETSELEDTKIFIFNKFIPIEFDKERNSFYYTEEVEFIFKFNKLKKEQLGKIIGGEKIFSKKMYSSLITTNASWGCIIASHFLSFFSFVLFSKLIDYKK